MNILSIYGGVGSMLLPAKKLKIKILGNIEPRKFAHYKDEKGKNTFEQNFKKIPFIKRQEIPDYFKINVDILTGHPSCGAYSLLNPNKGKDLSKKNTSEIPNFIQAIKIIKPNYFVMDNLPKSLEVVPVDAWYRHLSKRYDLFPEWVSNYHYGNVQQTRKRFFMIGAKKEKEFRFLPGEFENNIHLKDVIGSIHNQLYGFIENHFKHQRNVISLRSSGVFNYGEKCTWKELAAHFKNQKEGYILKYHAKDKTIKTRFGFRKSKWIGNCGVLVGVPTIHPKTNYPFSIRERLMIQGVDKNFVVYSEKLNSKNEWNSDENKTLIDQTAKFMPQQFICYILKQILYHETSRKFPCTGQRLINPNKLVQEAQEYLYGKDKSYEKKIFA